MSVQSFNPNPCFLIGLNSPSNLAFRRHHRMLMLQRLLPVLTDTLEEQQLADVSVDLELLYWPVLGHARHPYFFDVPAFLGSVPPDQPMEPALVVERLMATVCQPLPLDVAPAARNLERLRQHLDFSAAEAQRLLCAYLDYGGAAWPTLRLPLSVSQDLLAAWWGMVSVDVSSSLHGRLNTLGLLESPEKLALQFGGDRGYKLAWFAAMPTAVVQALSERYATDADLLNVLLLAR